MMSYKVVLVSETAISKFRLDRSRMLDFIEYSLLKLLDSKHTIILTKGDR